MPSFVNPEKCDGCKALDKPEGVVVSKCDVRACAREKKLDCCIECDELTTCDKDLWKRFPTFKLTITGHSAGVRPATTDRHPFIGSDSKHPAVMIFNGFGAKGALLIPWYAKQFASHLVNGEPLDPAADIRRHDTTPD